MSSLKKKKFSVELPSAVKETFGWICTATDEEELTSECLTLVETTGEKDDEFRFKFKFEKQEGEFEGFAWQHNGSWVIGPNRVSNEQMDAMLAHMSDENKCDLRDELCLEEEEEENSNEQKNGSESGSKAGFLSKFGIVPKFFYWPFHSDESGDSKNFDFCCRFANEASDHGIWCSWDKEKSNFQCYCFN